jgi:hypothetical protein
MAASMSRFHTSMYLHPWDVVDEGPRRVLGRIRSIGVENVNLATSYHSAKFLLAHNPKRKVIFAEEGVVYFKPDLGLYKNTILKPRRSQELGDIDVLELLLDSASEYGIGVNSWTVTFHNAAFGHAHPQLVIRDALDGLNYNHLCPNNPEVRNYHVALIKDLARYDLKAIMLESSCFPGSIVHGNHHEGSGIQIEPIISELMTACFCVHCAKRAKKSGLDLLKARKLVGRIIETGFRMPGYVLSDAPFSETVRTPSVLTNDFNLLHDLFSFQREVVDEVFAGARQALKDIGSKSKLYAIAPGNSSGGYLGGRGSNGMNLHSLSNIVDGIDFSVYVAEPELVYYLVKWAKFEVGGCPLHVVLMPCYPFAYTPYLISTEMKYALEAGADGLSFYNYGWIPTQNLEWVRNGLKSIGES